MLLVAAAAGLIIANSPIGHSVQELQHTYVGIPGVFELSVGHWIADGLLALFFFVVAVELQFELTNGQLNSARKALQPAIAAAGGVIVPIAVYLAFAWGTESADGWPIPTATDIAFALARACGSFCSRSRSSPTSSASSSSRCSSPTASTSLSLPLRQCSS